MFPATFVKLFTKFKHFKIREMYIDVLYLDSISIDGTSSQTKWVVTALFVIVNAEIGIGTRVLLGTIVIPGMSVFIWVSMDLQLSWYPGA